MPCGVGATPLTFAIVRASTATSAPFDVALTLIVYVPASSALPASFLPSHSNVRMPDFCAPRSIVRTTTPAASLIVTVTASASFAIAIA